MSDGPGDEARVSRHYTVTALGRRIEQALVKAGKDLDALTEADLAPVDAFHIRGRAATEELAGWVDLRPQHRVLDVGCGLGGTSRYLAAAVGCRTTGVDLTEEYCRTAAMLSDRVGLGGRTVFRPASALALPFPDAAFDVAWTEHVQMNVADKAGFYGEMHRVLDAGGRLVFHDIFAGDGGAVRYPVPWADDPSISHLVTAEDVRRLLTGLGCRERRWEETTGASTEFFGNVLGRLSKGGLPPLGVHLLMGENAGEKLANMHRNLDEGRIRVVQAVYARA